MIPKSIGSTLVERNTFPWMVAIESSKVYAKHGDDHPDALAGDMSSCKYSEGACTLRDGSAMIWTPSPEETCQFIPVHFSPGAKNVKNPTMEPALISFANKK
ncbi:hypothetical protein TELCIR_05429 [Teladorsagia circumcincta]|uniref:Uncharacterized protein n=1 Tax=Teladorsagia circumcincta TaxID=45464 RepID=A0A2G9USY9_TELCI|nr:hypothetical protein TELCIR_05429 [Teladorsagia circumcincta]